MRVDLTAIDLVRIDLVKGSRQHYLGQFLEEKISFDVQRHRQCASQCGGSINKLKAIAVQVRVYEMVVQCG